MVYSAYDNASVMGSSSDRIAEYERTIAPLRERYRKSSERVEGEKAEPSSVSVDAVSEVEQLEADLYGELTDEQSAEVLQWYVDAGGDVSELGVVTDREFFYDVLHDWSLEEMQSNVENGL